MICTLLTISLEIQSLCSNGLIDGNIPNRVESLTQQGITTKTSTYTARNFTVIDGGNGGSSRLARLLGKTISSRPRARTLTIPNSLPSGISSITTNETTDSIAITLEYANQSGAFEQSFQYAGNVETVTTRNSDGTVTTTTNLAQPISQAWSTDHLDKTTTYQFASGKQYQSTETINPTVSSNYAGVQEIRTLTYGDGHTETVSYPLTHMTSTWEDDHITRTTTYHYASGGSNSITDTVHPTLSTSYSANTQTVTRTYGDGFTETVSTATASRIRYAPITDDIQATYTFPDSTINVENTGFSWTNYTNRINNQAITFTGNGGMTMSSYRYSDDGTDLDRDIDLTLTYSSGALQKAIITGYDYTDGTYNFTDNGLQVTIGSSGSTGNIGLTRGYWYFNAPSGFTTFNTDFDIFTADYTSTFPQLGVNRLIISKPGSSYYNYATFGAWNVQWIQQQNAGDPLSYTSSYGSFYGGRESSSISAANGATFSGKVVGIDASNLSLTSSGVSVSPSLVTSDLSVTVNGTSLSFTASNSTLDGVSNNNWDFTGSATYGNYGGTNQFRGTVDFPNNSVSGLKGQIVGNFFGPNAEELAGSIKSTGTSYISTTSTADAGASTYEAAFGAKR